MKSLIPLSLFVLAAPCVASAQRSDFDWAKALSAGTVIAVHNISGSVTVVPGTGNRVEISAVRHGVARGANDVYVAVKEYTSEVDVCVLMKDSDESCDQEGAHMRSRRSHWDDDVRMDVTVHLPASMRIKANSVSGDVSITGAQGDVYASSVSGDIRMDDLHASSIRAETVSGKLTVAIKALTGNGDLKFKSVSGDVVLTVPKSFDADVSLSTVSGDFQSDLSFTLSGRMQRRGIHARAGAGGRSLDVSTVSGDLRLRAE
jgi:DUF4097 and DUF4098 domain-containing protein YvlB